MTATSKIFKKDKHFVYPFFIPKQSNLKTLNLIASCETKFYNCL